MTIRRIWMNGKRFWCLCFWHSQQIKSFSLFHSTEVSNTEKLIFSLLCFLKKTCSYAAQSWGYFSIAPCKPSFELRTINDTLVFSEAQLFFVSSLVDLLFKPSKHYYNNRCDMQQHDNPGSDLFLTELNLNNNRLNSIRSPVSPAPLPPLHWCNSISRFISIDLWFSIKET